MLKKISNKAFTLIELLASIAILGIILVLVTISYTKIRKNTLNKQYDNLKVLIEQAAIKYSSKSGSFSFFVQELIDENYIEPDDEDNIYDPRDDKPLNCHLISISEDKDILKASLQDEAFEKNGKCDVEKAGTYSSLLALNAKLSGTNIVYTPTTTSNGSGVYPNIINGWTKYDLDITADTSRIEEDLNGSHIIWNNIPENITYYPVVSTTTHEQVIYDMYYYADLYLANGNRYQARMKYKMDNEKPVIYHEKTTITKSTSNDNWTKSKVIVMYVTDKDGVGLDRIYVGPRPCSDLLVDGTIGQAAIPGLVQTYTYTGEVGEAGVNANVCAVDKLGNLADGGNVFVSKIDSIPPKVVTDLYLYDANLGTDYNSNYTNVIGTVTNNDVNTASFHSTTGGWTNTGHMYKFTVTDGGSGIAFSNRALFAYNINYPDYSEHYELTSWKPISRLSSFSTDTVNVFSAGISGAGKRVARFSVCDALGNCRTVNIRNENIDKTAPTLNVTTKSNNENYTGGWTMYDIYANVTYSDKGSGINTGAFYKKNTLTFPNWTIQTGATATGYNNHLWNNEGISTSSYKICDKVMNCTEKSFAMQLDKTAPFDVKSELRTNSKTGALRSNVDEYTADTVWWGNFSASDSLSGVKDYEYNSGPECRNNNGGTLDKVNGYTYNKDYNADFCMRAVDNAGNRSEWIKWIHIKVDKTAPKNVTYKLRKTGPNGTEIPNSPDIWYNSTIWWGNFNATDEYSGVKGYEYDYGESCNNYSDTRYLNTTDGHYYGGESGTYYADGANINFCMRAADNVGNKSAWQHVYIKVDKVKPTFTISNPSGGNWTGSNVTTSVSGSDPGGSQGASNARSGIKTIQFSDNNKSSWSTSWTNSTLPNPNKTWEASSGSLFNKTIYFRVQDNAGNWSDVQSTNVKIDKQKPSLSYVLKYPNGSAYSGSWTNGNVNAVMTYSDGSGSGIKTSSAAYHDNNSSTWTAVSGATSTTYTDVWSGEGNRTGYEHICDNVGNCSEVSFNVKIDKTKPVVKITGFKYKEDGDHIGDYLSQTLPISDGGTYEVSSSILKHGVMFEADVSDSASKVSSVKWYWEEKYNPSNYPALSDVNKGGSTYLTSDGVTYAGLTGDGYRIGKFVAVDNAGNSTTVYVKVKIKKDPYCYFTVSSIDDSTVNASGSAQNDWYRGNIHLTLNAVPSEGYSITKKEIHCCNDDKPWETKSEYVIDSETKPSGREMFGKVTDSSGKVAYCQGNFSKDVIPPKITASIGGTTYNLVTYTKASTPNNTVTASTSNLTVKKGTTVTFTCSDTITEPVAGYPYYSGFQSLKYKIDSGNYVDASSGSFSYTFNSTATVTFWCYDIAGNETWSARTVTVSSSNSGSTAGGGSSSSCNNACTVHYVTTGSCPSGVTKSPNGFCRNARFGCAEWGSWSQIGLTTYSAWLTDPRSGLSKTTGLPSWLNMGNVNMYFPGMYPINCTSPTSCSFTSNSGSYYGYKVERGSLNSYSVKKRICLKYKTGDQYMDDLGSSNTHARLVCCS